MVKHLGKLKKKNGIVFVCERCMVHSAWPLSMIERKKMRRWENERKEDQNKNIRICYLYVYEISSE